MKRLSTTFARLAALLAACAMAHAAGPVATELRIDTVPAGATIAVDGIELKTPSPITLPNPPPGEHLVVARLPGHREARQTVVVPDNESMATKLELEPIPGLLLLHSSPPGADVQIDGTDKGRTPLFLTDVPQGTRRVRFSLTGYAAKEMEVAIEGRTPRRLEAALASDSATLVLASTPSGADVTLNGVAAGKTPCTIERVKPGEATLEIRLGGHVPEVRTLRLSAGQKQEVTASLAPLPARLKVVSIPPKARVYVNNEFKGETPLSFTNLAAGSYRVRAELAGYEPLPRTIELAAGRESTEEFRLARDVATLELVTRPAGVKVTIDGRDMGTTKQPADAKDDAVSDVMKIELPAAATNAVTLSREGYLDEAFEVQLTRDKATRMQRTLKRNFVPDYEVRTSSEIVKGILIEVQTDGTIKIETRPGIFRVFQPGEIRSHKRLSP